MESIIYEENLEETFSSYKEKVNSLIDKIDENNKKVIYYISLLDKKSAVYFYNQTFDIINKLNALAPMLNDFKMGGSLRDDFFNIKIKYSSYFYEFRFLYDLLCGVKFESVDTEDTTPNFIFNSIDIL
jgi:hypothetical protein